MSEWVMAGLVVWPLIWGALTLILPSRWVLFAGALGALGTLALGVWVVSLPPQIMTLGNWPTPLGLSWRLDGISQSLIGLTAVVGGLISVYAGVDKSCPSVFWGLWLGAWGAMNALFLTADVFHFYVTLELLTVSAVAMVALTPSAAATRAAFRYLVVSLTGSMFFSTGCGITLWALWCAGYGDIVRADDNGLGQRTGIGGDDYWIVSKNCGFSVA